MLNRFELIGFLAGDAELRYASNGAPYVSWVLGVNKTGKNNDDVDFLDMVQFLKNEDQAETKAENFKRGSMVFAEGRISIIGEGRNKRKVLTVTTSYILRRKVEKVDYEEEDLSF